MALRVLSSNSMQQSLCAPITTVALVLSRVFAAAADNKQTHKPAKCSDLRIIYAQGRCVDFSFMNIFKGCCGQRRFDWSVFFRDLGFAVTQPRAHFEALLRRRRLPAFRTKTTETTFRERAWSSARKLELKIGLELIFVQVKPSVPHFRNLKATTGSTEKTYSLWAIDF